MSTEKYSDDEEINFGSFFNKIRVFLRDALKLLISIFIFYRRKIFLFLALLIVGMFTGYFIDKQLGFDLQFKQEIIIEPKYETVKYIYDYFDNLKYSFQDDDFIKKIELSSEVLLNLKGIEIEPVIQHHDVLEVYKNYTKTQDYDLHHIIEDLDFSKLEDEKYRDFFKYHRIIFTFKNSDIENTKISNNLLDHLKENQHFQKLLDITINQVTLELKQNKKSLEFINSYLNKMSETTSDKTNSTIVFGGEQDIPTVTSLLKKKEGILEEILKGEKVLQLDKEVFSIVEKGLIITSKASFKKRLIILLPIVLIGVTSLLYLIAFLWRVTLNFIEETKQ